MHVEFKLPTGAGGQSAHYSCSLLNRELARWQTVHGFELTTEVTYYKLTVRFHDEQALTMFALSWPTTQLKWRVCED